MDDKRLEAAAQEEKREYFRQWRKNNPDKVKKHNENYWRKRARVLATWWQWWSYLSTSYTHPIIFVILPLCIYSFSKFSLEVESTATTATKHRKHLHCGHFSGGSSHFYCHQYCH